MFVVCGEALFDLFPEETGDQSQLLFDARIGGSPFNVAVGIARMGRRSALLTGLSTDFLGEKLASALRREGVATDFLIRKSAPTTLSLVGLGADGSPQYVFYGDGAADRLVESSELPLFPDTVIGVHFGSYSIAVPPVADALSDLARREKGRRLISLDPNVRLNIMPDAAAWRRRVETLAAQADLLKISLEDVETLYPGEAPEGLVARWLGAGVGLVVVTRGGGGIFGATSGLAVELPAAPVEVVDTVGAGDTFQAALLAALDELGLANRAALNAIDRDTLRRILGFAARAAVITCTRRSADLPRRAELGEL
jgi:fructokinase